jgi:hypothetical protein
MSQIHISWLVPCICYFDHKRIYMCPEYLIISIRDNIGISMWPDYYISFGLLRVLVDLVCIIRLGLHASPESC